MRKFPDEYELQRRLRKRSGLKDSKVVSSCREHLPRPPVCSFEANNQTRGRANPFDISNKEIEYRNQCLEFCKDQINAKVYYFCAQLSRRLATLESVKLEDELRRKQAITKLLELPRDVLDYEPEIYTTPDELDYAKANFKRR